MALFNVSVWQRSRFTLQWFIINLVGSLACFTAVALAQFEWSEGVSGSVFIPDVAFTCLGNLAVFMTAFTRGRLDVENGARDALATTRGPKLNVLINGRGLTTRPPNDLTDIDVVLLSKYNERPHSSLTEFMKYVSHAHSLESILLQFFSLKSSPDTALPMRCECADCQCVVFWATEVIMVMLAHRLPGTLKRLSESQCLLPSLRCLKNGCHGCNQGLLYVDYLPDEGSAGESSERGTSERRLRDDNPRVDSPAAVCEALNQSLFEEEESSCICIPVYPANADRWTKFMIKFLKSKEKEAKGIKVVVSDALQHYITHSAQELGFLFQSVTGCIFAREIYERASLILPRVAEVIVNVGLTMWLRVDGFSSSLVARRAIRDYVVDSAGTGFGAKAFLTKAMVFCSGDRTNVCQVLWFRGGILSARRVSYMVGFVNMICSITWSVLIACLGNWAPSMPLSTPRVSVIIGAVGFALGMDCFEVYRGDVLARSGAWARHLGLAGYGDMGRAEAQGRVQDMVRYRLQALAQAQAQAQVNARDRDRDQARDQDQARALSEVLVQARDQALAVALAQDLDQARDQVLDQARDQFQAQALDQDRDQALAWARNPLALVLTLVRDQVLVRYQVQAQAWQMGLAGDRARAQQAQDEAQVWAQVWAPAFEAQSRASAYILLWWLVAVVILEVGCIVSLVVMLSLKEGLGRWVYSGMQVLVWVKWGIGSFLLGDKATEDEDGSPYLFWIEKKGTWVYCSAFLLNAMLAAVRGKWKWKNS